VIALAVCIAAAAIAVLCYRGRKPVFFFIALFFVALAPTANIAMPIGSIMAERFLYLPSVGFAACLVLAVYAAGRRLRLAAPIALAVVTLAFAARTFSRNFDWQDNDSLTASAIHTCPASFKTHMLRATVLVRSEGVDAAIAEIEKSIAILDPLPDDRNTDWVYINAASYYRQKGERLAAESGFWYRKSLATIERAQRIASLRHDPADPAKYQLDFDLGRTWMRLQDPARAAQFFDSALEQGIGADLYQERSAAWRAAGDPRRAILSYLEARVIETSLPLSKIADLYQPSCPGMECAQLHADVCTAYRNVAQVYAKTFHGHWAEDTKRIALSQGCQ
jgi:tetratricopeptide (TPR) repeat protein